MSSCNASSTQFTGVFNAFALIQPGQLLFGSLPADGARIVAQIRRHWPLGRILLRADSGFAREELMAWSEANGVHFLFGLAKTDRLTSEIKAELEQAAAQSRRTGKT